jgi:dolichyl-diphosphooligosaccharide--protein glycosyltransferase
MADAHAHADRVCICSSCSLFDTYVDPMEPEVSDGDKADKSKKDKSTAPSASGASVAELLTEMVTSGSSTPKKSKPAQRRIFGLDMRAAVIVNALAMLTFFVVHCTWVTSMA